MQTLTELNEEVRNFIANPHVLNRNPAFGFADLRIGEFSFTLQRSVRYPERTFIFDQNRGSGCFAYTDDPSAIAVFVTGCHEYQRQKISTAVLHLERSAAFQMVGQTGLCPNCGKSVKATRSSTGVASDYSTMSDFVQYSCECGFRVNAIRTAIVTAVTANADSRGYSGGESRVTGWVVE